MKDNLDRPGPRNLPAVPVSVLSDSLEQLKLSDSTSAPLMENADEETALKPKRNWHTLKALHILNNIDSRIQQCFHLLLHTCNLDDIGRKLSLLCTAMKNLNGGADAVVARKRQSQHRWTTWLPSSAATRMYFKYP
jgi:hypothetical protein